MDSDQLRYILVALGVLLVLGIYAWDRYRRRHDRRRNTQARAARTGSGRDRQADKGPAEQGAQPGVAPQAAAGGSSPGDNQEPFIGDFSMPREAAAENPAGAAASGTGPAPDAAPAAPKQTGAEPAARTGWDDISLGGDPQITLDLNFSAHADSDYLNMDPDLYDELPRKIIQINLVAGKGRTFAGALIEKAAAEVGLLAGDMSIYHRHEGAAADPVVFSMASLVEPGSFPFAEMHSFETPGLTLFTQLPGVRDGLAIYSDMLFTAQRLAVLLQGTLLDETHSALTKQAIAHTREGILEHRRQIQLLRSRYQK